MSTTTNFDPASPRKRRLRVNRYVAIAIGCVAFLAIVASASGLVLRAGDLVITADGGFTPKALPKHEDAPITLHGGGKLTTVTGELPPILDTLTIEFDRHGHVDTTGLPVCTEAKLVATTVATARKLCPGAIVGKGFGSAVVKFPEQGRIPVSSPITIFNGPKKGGNYTVIAHAHLDYPGPATFIVPIVIEKINKGVYGYRTKVKIPKIAGGYGHPVSGSAKVGRIWTFKGKKHSFVNARCETGHLQARTEFTFKDDTVLNGTFLRPCKVRN
jgi:hypothetical protein